MHDKLRNKIYNKADKEIDDHMRKCRKDIRSSLANYRKIIGVVLDEAVNQTELRKAIFTAIDATTLQTEMGIIEEMLGNHYSDSFKRVVIRYSYMCQFAPALLKHITFEPDTQDAASSDLIKAIKLLNRMNDEGKHTLPKNAPTGFIPSKLQSFVFQGSLQETDYKVR